MPVSQVRVQAGQTGATAAPHLTRHAALLVMFPHTMQGLDILLKVVHFLQLSDAPRSQTAVIPPHLPRSSFSSSTPSSPSGPGPVPVLQLGVHVGQAAD